MSRPTLPLPSPARPARLALACALAVGAALLLAGCGKKKTELGQGGSVVTGSAGPAGASNASHELLRCDAPVATMALVENPNGYTIQGANNLPSSPLPLVRLIAQQSGCFRVVDRSSGLRATEQEQELQDKGLIRRNTTLHKGNGYEAQYTLVPSLTFSEQDAGRQIGGVLGAIPVLNKFAGVADSVKLKEAQVTLLLTDNETTEQVAAATGSVRVTDLGVAGLMLGRAGGAAGAGWSNTNEGKVIAAAFLDAHNQLVTQLRALQAKELPPAIPTKKPGSAG
ncbi:MAG TPA: CsgG/HfaB family protein [Burkholderiaceae bacterium]